MILTIALVTEPNVPIDALLTGGRHVQSPLIGASVGIGLAFLLPLRGRPTWRGREFAMECLLIVGAYALYEVGRMSTQSSYAPAYTNALWVLGFEDSLRLHVEADVQQFVIGHEITMHVFNLLYSVYLPVTVGVLTWLFWTDRAAYRLLRNTLGISVILAIATIALFPVAPPRLVPDAGIFDTFAATGAPQKFANQFAAVPSLHVGWTAACGFAVGRCLGGRWRLPVSILPPAVMLLTVMATGNHYWFDGLIGIAFTIGPALLMTSAWRSRTPEDRRATTQQRRLQDAE